jgi:hypothetical protein
VTSAAVIVGIDNYAAQPLTSAVRDAEAMRDSLVGLGLVQPADVVLLTAPDPPVAGAELPTRKAILNALLPFYTGARAVDRLFFAYAGHGLLAFSDAARALARTALLPVDVKDINSDGDLLIDFDSVLDRFRLAGPKEQFFFIDACRDLAYEEHPDISSSLGWAAVPPGPERAQAVLYAVPPLGRARSEQDGRGVMTGHLLDALEGKGIALDYSDELRRYVVTAESVAAYVVKRVAETVRTVPLWERTYSLPRLDHPGQKTGSIREVAHPPDAPLVVRIDPEAAAARTEVWLSQMDLRVCSWPPNAYDEPWLVKPRRYWLEATSEAGQPEPDQMRLDVREEQEAVVRIRPPGEETLGLHVSPEPGPSPALVETRDGPPSEGPARTPRRDAAVHVRALEPESVIELERLDPPYTHWSSAHELHEDVPPGAYRVRVRLGKDVYSESELQLSPGQTIEVQPTVGASPLLNELLQGRTEATDAVISESIGSIQAGLLPTALPIVGIKPFDQKNELFSQFTGFVPPSDPGEFGMRPVSVVVGVDGNDWPEGVDAVVRSASASIELRGADPIGIELAPIEYGGGRIALGVAQAPGRPFALRIESPYFGSVGLAAASLERRATVVTLTVRPSGSFDVSQNLLRIPGLHYDELVQHVSYGRMLRDLQVGQKLYESGELALGRVSSQLLMELFYAKWTDPILSCMAYFAWTDAANQGQMARVVADNLFRYFGDLVDARIIHALEHPELKQRHLAEIVELNEVPVLARSALELEQQAPNAELVRSLIKRVTPDQAWLLTWSAEMLKTPAAAEALAVT